MSRYNVLLKSISPGMEFQSIIPTTVRRTSCWTENHVKVIAERFSCRFEVEISA